MSPELKNGVKLFTIATASLGAVGSGFVYLSLPVGIILKMTGVALEVFGIYGLHCLSDSIPEGVNWAEVNLNNIMDKVRSRWTYKGLALNAVLIGVISSCYIVTMGVM